MQPTMISIALAILLYVVSFNNLAQAQPCPNIPFVPQAGTYPLAKTNRTIPPFFTNQATAFKLVNTYSECKHICRRRDIRTWSPPEWKLFGQLWNEANNRGYWWDLQLMHAQDCRCEVDNICAFHANKAFFPWHRFYITHIEQMLQKIDHEINPGRAVRQGEFCLGYWDWGYQGPFDNDLTSDTYKYIFNPNAAGTMTNGSNHILDGPFKDLRIPLTGSPYNYTIRDPSPGNNSWNTATVSNCLAIHNIEGDGNPTNGFSPCIEGGAHGNVHFQMGGPDGTMGSVPWAAGDPVFFLHHTMVDYIYWIWQHNPQSFYPTNPQYQDQTPQPYDKWTLNDAKDWGRFCFDYIPNGNVLAQNNYTSGSSLPSSWNNVTQGCKDSVQKAISDGPPGLQSKDKYYKKWQAIGWPDAVIEQFYVNYTRSVAHSQDTYNNLTAYYNHAKRSSGKAGTVGTEKLDVDSYDTASSNKTVDMTVVAAYMNAMAGTNN